MLTQARNSFALCEVKIALVGVFRFEFFFWLRQGFIAILECIRIGKLSHLIKHIEPTQYGAEVANNTSSGIINLRVCAHAYVTTALSCSLVFDLCITSGT